MIPNKDMKFDNPVKSVQYCEDIQRLDFLVLSKHWRYKILFTSKIHPDTKDYMLVQRNNTKRKYKKYKLN